VFPPPGELKFNLDWRRIVHAFEFVLFAVGGIVRRCPQPVLVRQFVGLNERLLYQIVVVVCEIPDVLSGGKGSCAEK